MRGDLGAQRLGRAIAGDARFNDCRCRVWRCVGFRATPSSVKARLAMILRGELFGENRVVLARGFMPYLFAIAAVLARVHGRMSAVP